MFSSPNKNNKKKKDKNESTSSSSSTSSVWSSPNIGQMTEMSQEWYRKMMSDGAELIKLSLDPEYKEIDFSAFITQSQPPPHIPSNQSFDETVFPFNSLPLTEESSIDFNFMGGALLTPVSSSISHLSTHASSSVSNTIVPSPIKSNRGTSARGRKYHNTNLLAQYCQEILSKTAHPSIGQISEIVNKLYYPGGPTEKKLKSLIREWFRKRREYMATKIYRSCQNLLPPYPTGSREHDISEFIKTIQSNYALIGIIMLESKLPMESEIERMDFVKEKIIDYYLKYPQRKLRNSVGFKNIRNKMESDDEGYGEDGGEGEDDFDLFIK